MVVVVFLFILVIDYLVDDVFVSLFLFKVVFMIEIGIFVGFLLYIRFDNNKFFINIGFCN